MWKILELQRELCNAKLINMDTRKMIQTQTIAETWEKNNKRKTEFRYKSKRNKNATSIIPCSFQPHIERGSHFFLSDINDNIG